MIKESLQQEDITYVNIYAPNTEALKYIKQTLTDLKRETDNNTIVGNFKTPLTSMDRSFTQKIHKETSALNDTLDQMNLTGISRKFHPKATQYTFFSSTHETLSRIDNMLGQKTSLNKFKRTEIVSSIFSRHNGMKPEINYMKLENSKIGGD